MQLLPLTYSLHLLLYLFTFHIPSSTYPHYSLHIEELFSEKDAFKHLFHTIQLPI